MRTEELLALGVFGAGSRLGDRIEILLKRGRDFSARASRTRLIASAAVLAGLLAAASVAPRWIAFAQEPAAFEVASIKLSAANESGGTTFEPDGVTIRRASLLELICAAYQMPYSRVRASGGNVKLAPERYDVVAKAGQPEPRPQLLLMLQTLLADRFKVTLHRESKVEPVYNLVVAKGGLKMEPSVPGRAPSAACQFPQCVAIEHTEMWVLAATLSGRMGRPVLDRTGLTGAYNGALRLDIMQNVSAADPGLKPRLLDWSQSSIFDDIEKQLGLRLEAARAPVESIVVDHAEARDAN